MLSSEMEESEIEFVCKHLHIMKKYMLASIIEEGEIEFVCKHLLNAWPEYKVHLNFQHIQRPVLLKRNVNEYRRIPLEQ